MLLQYRWLSIKYLSSWQAFSAAWLGIWLQNDTESEFIVNYKQRASLPFCITPCYSKASQCCAATHVSSPTGHHWWLSMLHNLTSGAGSFSSSFWLCLLPAWARPVTDKNPCSLPLFKRGVKSMTFCLVTFSSHSLFHIPFVVPMFQADKLSELISSLANFK